jgi:hypothetical protein
MRADAGEVWLTCRDGPLLAIKASGKDHWERHLAGDELIHILDGTATVPTLEIVRNDGPPISFPMSAGMVAVIPQGAWHRLLSPPARGTDFKSLETQMGFRVLRKFLPLGGPPEKRSQKAIVCAFARIPRIWASMSDREPFSRLWLQ